MDVLYVIDECLPMPGSKVMPADVMEARNRVCLLMQAAERLLAEFPSTSRSYAARFAQTDLREAIKNCKSA